MDGRLAREYKSEPPRCKGRFGLTDLPKGASAIVTEVRTVCSPTRAQTFVTSHIARAGIAQRRREDNETTPLPAGVLHPPTALFRLRRGLWKSFSRSRVC